MHHFLYAYSPDVFDSKDDYPARYPGEAYVDVLGFDDDQSVRTPATRAVFVRRLHDVAELAGARGKLAALTCARFRRDPLIAFDGDVPDLYHTRDRSPQ